MADYRECLVVPSDEFLGFSYKRGVKSREITRGRGCNYEESSERSKGGRREKGRLWRTARAKHEAITPNHEENAIPLWNCSLAAGYTSRRGNAAKLSRKSDCFVAYSIIEPCLKWRNNRARLTREIYHETPSRTQLLVLNTYVKMIKFC